MRKIMSLTLFVVAVMLTATPGTEARFYIDIPGVETNCIPASTPLTIEVKMDNNTGENVIGISNGICIYSPDGAVWETPVYYSTGALEPYLDGDVVVNGLGVDGIGEDTITLGGYASLEPGVPNGYDDVVLKIETQFDAAQIGKTICIDSTWFPPGGSWQWVTPSGSVVPDWEGPHCWEVVAPLATIEGTVFYDADGDGVWGPSESGMDDVRVYLTDGTATVPADTGPDGEYSFTNLAAGVYRVYEDVPSGYLQTFPTSVSYVFTTPGYAYYTDVDFGNTDTTCESEIEIDTCFAGTYDDFVGAEPSSPDAALLATMGNATYGANPYFDSVCINQAFGHTFSGCWPESCKVIGATLCMKLKATGSVPTTDKLYLGEWDSIGNFWAINLNDLEDFAGGDGNWNHDNVMTVCLDLKNLPAAGVGGPQNLLGGLQDGRLDVLISDDTEVDYLELIVEVCCPRGTIEGTVFYDDDGDGVWDQPWDTAMPGVTVHLMGTATGTAVTGSNGKYSFIDLAAGTYRVYEDVPSGYIQTFPTSVVYKFVMTGYADHTNVDFLNADTTCIGGTIDFDTCFAGTDDDFVGAEPSSPDAELLAWMGLSSSGANPYFDSVCINQGFGHTFSGCWPESCKVVGATLCMKLKATGSGSYTDGLYLGEWDDENRHFWAINLSDLEDFAGGNDLWILGDMMTVCLDLANMPAAGVGGPQNLLGGLQDGRLDILIADDTEVDYLELIVEICCGAIPSDTGIIVYPSDTVGGKGVTIYCGEPVTFNVHLYNYYDTIIRGIANGFRLYSPDGATWETPVYYSTGNLEPYLDGDVIVNGFDVDGISEDTIIIAGYTMYEPGVPNGYDGVVVKIETQFDAAQEGKTFCIDSTFFPPSGTWVWSYSGGSLIPGWGGPYCWIIVMPDTCYADGDANGNGTPFEAADAVELANVLVNCASLTAPLYRVDLNGDCLVDSLDLILMVEFITMQDTSIFDPYGGYPVPTCCDPDLNRNPQTLEIFGFEHTSIGSGCIDTSGGVLEVTSDQPDGESCVAIGLQGPYIAFGVNMEVYDSDPPVGAEMTTIVEATVGGSPGVAIASTHREKRSDHVDFYFDFDPSVMGSANLVYHVYDGCEEVISVTIPPCTVEVYSTSRSFGDPLDGIDVVLLKKPENSVARGVQFDEDFDFVLPGPVLATGTRIEVFPAEPGTPVDSLTAVDIRTRNISFCGVIDEQATINDIDFLWGRPHSAIGFCVIDTSDNGDTLTVTDLGIWAENGVVVELGESKQTYAVGFDIPDPDSLPTGAKLTTEIRGVVNSVEQPIVSYSKRQEAGYVAINVEFGACIVIDSSNLLYEVLNDCEVVASMEALAGEIEVHQLARGAGDPYNGLDVATITTKALASLKKIHVGTIWPEEYQIIAPGPFMSVGNQIRVSPVSQTAAVESYSVASIKSCNLGSYGVIDEEATISDTKHRFGLPHYNIGFCVIDTTENGDTLVVSDPGIGCENAVSVDITGRTAWQGEFCTPDSDSLVYGASRTITVTGMVDDTPLRDLLSYCKRKCDDTIYITADFDPTILGSSDLRYEVLRNGRLVSVIKAPPGQVTVTDPSAGRSFGDPLGGIDVVLLKAPPAGMCGSTDWDDTDSLEIALPDQAAVYGNQLRIILENPAQPVDSLDEIKIQTNEIATYSICYEQAATTESMEFFDVMLWSLGFATLTLVDTTLVVGNIGSSGEDGVRFDLGEAPRYDAVWEDIDPEGTIDNGAYYEITKYGGGVGFTDQIANVFQAEKVGGEWGLSANFDDVGSISITLVAVLEDSVIVFDSNYVAPVIWWPHPPDDDHWPSPWPLPSPWPFPEYKDGAKMGTGSNGCWPTEDDGPFPFLFPASPTKGSTDIIIADCIGLVPEDATYDFDNLSKVEFRLSGIPEIVFTSLTTGCCVGIRGNVNNIGEIDIADLVYLVDYMFSGGPQPPCLEEADINGSGGIDISDLVYLVNYMFTGGPPPVVCP